MVVPSGELTTISKNNAIIYMELFGIALSVPAAFIASIVYGKILVKLVLQFSYIRRWLWAASILVLVLFAAEVLFISTLGIQRSNSYLGPIFETSHLLLFFLGTPALATFLLLRPRSRLPEGPYTYKILIVAALCTVFALAHVLLQYTVSETLHGIE